MWLTATLDDNDLVLVVQTLIHKCMENEHLCNEAYLQLIKQTTDTKTGAIGLTFWPLNFWPSFNIQRAEPDSEQSQLDPKAAIVSRRRPPQN